MGLIMTFLNKKIVLALALVSNSLHADSNIINTLDKKITKAFIGFMYEIGYEPSSERIQTITKEAQQLLGIHEQDYVTAMEVPSELCNSSFFDGPAYATQFNTIYTNRYQLDTMSHGAQLAYLATQAGLTKRMKTIKNLILTLPPFVVGYIAINNFLKNKDFCATGLKSVIRWNAAYLGSSLIITIPWRAYYLYQYRQSEKEAFLALQCQDCADECIEYRKQTFPLKKNIYNLIYALPYYFSPEALEKMKQEHLMGKCCQYHQDLHAATTVEAA